MGIRCISHSMSVRVSGRGGGPTVLSDRACTSEDHGWLSCILAAATIPRCLQADSNGGWTVEGNDYSTNTDRERGCLVKRDVGWEL